MVTTITLASGKVISEKEWPYTPQGCTHVYLVISQLPASPGERAWTVEIKPGPTLEQLYNDQNYHFYDDAFLILPVEDVPTGIPLQGKIGYLKTYSNWRGSISKTDFWKKIEKTFDISIYKSFLDVTPTTWQVAFCNS